MDYKSEKVRNIGITEEAIGTIVAAGKYQIPLSIRCTNVGVSNIKVNVWIRDSLSNDTYIIKEATIAPGGAEDYIGANEIPMMVGDTLYAISDTASSLDVVYGYVEKSVSYTGNDLYGRGYLDGMILSQGSNPDTQIDIGIGACRDEDNTQNIDRIVPLTIDLTTTGNNGIVNGALGINTWYHILIGVDTSSGNVVGGASQALAIPATWSIWRRLGSIKTDGSSLITDFIQIGDRFMWKSPVTDVNVSNLGLTATLYSLTVAPDVNVESFGTFYMYHQTQFSFDGYLFSPLINTQTADASLGRSYSDDAQQYSPNSGEFHIMTNTSRQIYAVSSDANTDLRMSTQGWIDMRGKQ